MKISRTEVVATTRWYVRNNLKGYREVDIASEYYEMYDCTMVKVYLVNRYHQMFKLGFEINNSGEIIVDINKELRRID